MTIESTSISSSKRRHARGQRGVAGSAEARALIWYDGASALIWYDGATVLIWYDGISGLI
jgi:hypothetical protein